MNATIRRELERWDESPEMAVAILSRWKAQIKPKVSVKRSKPKPWIKVHRDGREVLNLDTERGRAEYRRRTDAMAERQGDVCACGCGVPFAHSSGPTFDHENGRGGGKHDDRIEVKGKWQNAALCWICNYNKGSRRIPYAITQESVESRRDDTCQ